MRPHLASIGALLTFIFLNTALAASGRTFLVSAGVCDYTSYPGVASDLRLPVSDATTVSEVYGCDRDLSHVLLLDKEATRKSVLEAITQTFREAEEEDIVVFFFSGHGYPGGFCLADGPVSYGEMREAMAASKSRNKMIFADACRAGGMRVERSANADEPSKKEGSVMLFLSSRTDENSHERADMKNGYFTEYLRKGLQGEADANDDRIITAKELFQFVHKGVVKISGNHQHPVMWGKFSDDMPVMKR